MKRCKRTIALMLGLLMCLALIAACGGTTAPDPGISQPTGQPTQPPSVPTNPGLASPAPTDPSVRFAEHIDLIQTNDSSSVINPFSPAANTGPTLWKVGLVLDRLIRWDGDAGAFVPSLASSWTTTDFQTFSFTLRDDVYFHNGDHFTAQDVVNTIEHAQEVGAGSPGGAHWTAVQSARAISPTQLEIVLNRVFIDFYFELAAPSAGIINLRAITEDSDRGYWIGTGAFIVEDYVSGDAARFVRNDNYWDESVNVVTQRLTIRFVPELSVRTVRMQTGESQISFGTIPEDMHIFEADPDNYDVFGFMFNMPTMFSFNMNDPLMADPNLRMAILYAANKEDITYVAAGEWAMAVNDSGTLWGSLMPFRNNDIPPILQDLDKSREYLALSSYNGEEIEIAAANVSNVRSAQVLQQQLIAVGIRSRVVEYDTPGINRHMLNPDGGSQIVMLAVQFTLSPSSYRNIFYPGGSQNRMHYNNPIITQMLDEVGTMFDERAREAHYLRMQEIIAEDPPYGSVYHRIMNVVAVRGLGGIKLSSDNRWHDFREIYLIED